MDIEVRVMFQGVPFEFDYGELNNDASEVAVESAIGSEIEDTDVAELLRNATSATLSDPRVTVLKLDKSTREDD